MPRAKKETTVVVGSTTGLAPCDTCDAGTANRVHGRPQHAWCAAGLSIAAWWDRTAAKLVKRRQPTEITVDVEDLDDDGPVYKDKGADLHDASLLPRRPESRARRALDPPAPDGTFDRPVYPGNRHTFMLDAYERLDELTAAAETSEASDAA